MPLSAVFHTSSLQKQVAALSDAFAIAGEFLHCDVINSGHINMTFRATYRKPDGTTRRYIFQRVNDAVFPCPRDGILGIAMASMVPTNSDEIYIKKYIRRRISYLQT